MTLLTVRKPKFEFSGGVDFAWNPGNPVFSLGMNATTFIAISFEKFIVAATREAIPLIEDPAVRAEAEAFADQEGAHAAAHRRHARALMTKYPGLEGLLDDLIASYDHLTATRSLQWRLAYIADLEATFTPNFKVMLDHHETLFGPGDDRVASLFLWHFVEEVEHRSSGLVVYDDVVKSKWYRTRQVPGVVRHLYSIMELIAHGFNEHVPFADRQVDAQVMLPKYALKQALRRALRRPGTPPKPPARFPDVPTSERLTSLKGLLASQMPYHDPEHQPLPAFADEWFAAYDDGADVVRWYGQGSRAAVDAAPAAISASVG